MSRTTFSGPVKSTNGFTPGTSAVALTQIMKGTVAVDPASITAQESAETSVTITGAATGDVVIMNPPASLETGLAFSGARVSAADTVQVRLTNVTGGAVDGTSRTWTYAILRMA